MAAIGRWGCGPGFRRVGFLPTSGRHSDTTGLTGDLTRTGRIELAAAHRHSDYLGGRRWALPVKTRESPSAFMRGYIVAGGRKSTSSEEGDTSQMKANNVCRCCREPAGTDLSYNELGTVC